MKITKVIRTRSAQCYPQVVDLKHFSSFDFLPSGCIVATSLDGKSGEVFRSWDSADFENESVELKKEFPGLADWLPDETVTKNEPGAKVTGGYPGPKRNESAPLPIDFDDPRNVKATELAPVDITRLNKYPAKPVKR
jgi:hypothetical protein